MAPYRRGFFGFGHRILTPKTELRVPKPITETTAFRDGPRRKDHLLVAHKRVDARFRETLCQGTHLSQVADYQRRLVHRGVVRVVVRM